MTRGKVNAALRMVAWNNMASAITITGSEKVRNGFGNGDCVIMDFDHHVFAISDSSERYSFASRILLNRMHERLCANGVPTTVDRWQSFANEVYADQEYRFKATFSCVAFQLNDRVKTIFVLNGGDSTIALVNAENWEIEYISKPDMNFAGRSNTIAQVKEMKVHQQMRVVLFSDGMTDIAKVCGKGVFEFIMPFVSESVESVPQRICMELKKAIMHGHAEYDDASLVVLNPSAYSRCEGRVLLMGGSTPQEEMHYQKNVCQSGKWNRWRGIDEMADNAELSRECCIHIIH